ncbi:hypothetical protein DIPPA_26889 [Diplonema papillatum]|nr:hypothetical protein DIPPA_26889 [Diplonema papillatum]
MHDVRGDVSTLKAEVDQLSGALADVVSTLNMIVDQQQHQLHSTGCFPRTPSGARYESRKMRYLSDPSDSPCCDPASTEACIAIQRAITALRRQPPVPLDPPSTQYSLGRHPTDTKHRLSTGRGNAPPPHPKNFY